MKELNELTVVTTQKDKIARENKEAFPFIRINAKAGKVFIGVEKETKPGDKIKLEYRVLNKDFSFSKSDYVTLPLEYNAGRRGKGVDGMSSRYDLGDDGNMHIRSTINPTRKQVKDTKRKSNRTDKIENLNKLNSDELKEFELLLNFTDKELSSWLVDNKKNIDLENFSISKKIKEFNPGIYIFKIPQLFSELKRIESNNASNEYYLTDVIELIKENFPVQTEKISNPAEVIGINTINQLSDLENNN